MVVFKIIILFIIVIAVILLAGFGYFTFRVSQPIDASAAAFQEFVVQEGWGVKQIAQALRNDGLIANDTYFILHVFLEGKSGAMQAGVYELSPAMDIVTIVERVTGGEVRSFERITIPEGFSDVQIEEHLLAEGLSFGRGEFLNLARLSTTAAVQIFDYPFLQDITAPKLEGFLFPDTYEFRLDESAEEVLDKFLANFEIKTKNLITRGESFYDALILASLIEREVQTEEDMKIVSGVLHNRLEIGMPLQIDATLAYLTGKKTGEITNQDKLIDSPYNTYKYRGLPFAPITNPGLRAIEAALNPTPTDYFYYLSASDGTTIFSKTLQEHNINKAQYLR